MPTIPLLRFLLAALVISPPLAACPICVGLGPRPLTLGESLIAAEVIAVVTPGEGRSYDVREVLRGGEALAGTSFEDPAGFRQERLLAVRAPEAGAWKILGPYDPELQPLVRRCLPLRPLADEAEDGLWQARLDLFEKDLGHEDYRIGSSAWAVWATAPYRILARRTSTPAAETLLGWIDLRRRPNEKALWWSLLGLHPNERTRARVRAGLEEARKAGQTENLAAMLSAHLAHEGKAAVTFIEKRYLGDASRSPDEVRMALLALGLHGTEFEDRRPAARGVLAAFARERPPLSGYVAPFLAKWEDFSLEGHFRALMVSGDPRIPADSKAAIIGYLKACREAAKAP